MISIRGISILSAVFFLLSCVPQATVNSENGIVETSVVENTSPGDVEEYVATGWKINKRSLGSVSLRSVSFGTRLSGWITGIRGKEVSITEVGRADSSHIFRTDDGGATWHDVSLPIPKGACVGKVQFSNQQDGWIGFQNGSCGGKSSSFELLGTRDGGTTWSTLFARNDFIGRSIVKNPDGTGWLAGVSTKGVEKVEVLRTEDSGKNWDTVYSSNNTSHRSTVDIKPAPPRIDDLSQIDPNTTLLVFSDSTVVQLSLDGGQWVSSRIGERSVEIGSNKFLATNSQDWILSSSRVSQGKIWSTILGKDTTTEKRIDDIFFTEILSSTNFAIASGFTLSITPNDDKTTHMIQNAVVMLTNDSGQSWELIYKLSAHSEIIRAVGPSREMTVETVQSYPGARDSKIRFFDLTSFDTDRYIAVGDEGLVISISKEE